jgi:hypothetical protein
VPGEDNNIHLSRPLGPQNLEPGLFDHGARQGRVEHMMMQAALVGIA